ncbi:MAG: hypothetical protein DMD65_14520 [Gemmatimonadetes bacterium]|nr:MAG: hypothetical protein DMD65_14520 [Gemmatimonadota bacterium]
MRDARSASHSDAAMASCTMASAERPAAASDSAAFITVSPFAKSVGVAPASSARRSALTAAVRRARTRLSSRCSAAARAVDSAAGAAGAAAAGAVWCATGRFV